MSDILTGTPPELTYLHPLVRQAWMVVWAVTSGALVVILGWIGLTLIMQEHLGGGRAGWQEMGPRLILGLVGSAMVAVGVSTMVLSQEGVSGAIVASIVDGSPLSELHAATKAPTITSKTTETQNP